MIRNHSQKSILVVAPECAWMRTSAPTDLQLFLHSLLASFQVATAGTTCGALGSSIQNRRKFKIDDAEPTIRGSVGDVPQKCILMPNAKRLKLGKQFLDLALAQMLNPSSAIASDYLQCPWVAIKQTRDKRATSIFQVPEHSAFIIKALESIRAQELFMNTSVIPNAHQSALGILGF
jgi:hypothetical protein